MASSIRVATPEGDYEIRIGHGLLNTIDENLPSGRRVVITNATIAPLYGPQILQSTVDCALVTMPDGEQFKTLNTAARLYGDLVESGLDRSGTVIALGGGVVGDTAGFVAATYMRGVRLIQVPTSLLSMVDSSVGGKVGVDLPLGKNLVGAFKQPECVIIDPQVLSTLPEREWRCGMAEIVKHGMIADVGLLSPTLWTKDQAEELVERAVQVKVDIVEKDPYERNVRAYLNLGHTFAHAIERVSKFSWLHGEAVGVGLVAAARLSHAVGLCHSGLAEEIEDVVQQVGLPTRLGALDPSALWAAMGTDKKWQSGHSRFVLLKDMCEPTIVEDISEDVVTRILHDMLG